MLHIHALVLKKDLSTLITPILQNAARKEMVKAPMKCIKSFQPSPIFTLMEKHVYAYGRTRPASSQKLCQLPMLQTAFGSRDNSLKACLSCTVLTHMHAPPLMMYKPSNFN